MDRKEQLQNPIVREGEELRPGVSSPNATGSANSRFALTTTTRTTDTVILVAADGSGLYFRKMKV
jgi:hypothetical protein